MKEIEGDLGIQAVNLSGSSVHAKNATILNLFGQAVSSVGSAASKSCGNEWYLRFSVFQAWGGG
jgi:hypothetical protein